MTDPRFDSSRGDAPYAGNAYGVTSYGGGGGYPSRPPEFRSEGGAIGRILTVLRPHVKLVAALTIASGAVAAYLIAREVPTYRARAVLQLVDAHEILPKEFGTRQPEQSSGQQNVDPVRSAMMVLQGRGVLGEVADSEAAIRGVARSRGARDDAIDSVGAKLRAVARDGTNGMDVEYVSTDSAAAVRIVNAAVTTFQRVDARMARQEANLRRTFLKEQLQSTDSLLARAQANLSEFRSRKQIYSSRDALVAQQMNMAQLDIRRGDLDADRRTYQTLLDRLNRSSGSVGIDLQALVSSPGASSNPVITQLYTQLAQYQIERDSLTAGEWGRAATHPDVQRVDQLITSTRGRLVDAMQSQIGALGARIGALDGLRSKSGAQLQTLPNDESEEVRLSDQVATLTNTGNQLRSEDQNARIAEAVQAGRVNIINLASRAQAVSTHRGMRLVFGVLLGLLVGVAGAFLLELFNTSIRHRDEIESLLQIPGLAVIPGTPRPATARIAGARHPMIGTLRLGGARADRSDADDGDSTDAGPRLDEIPAYSHAAEAYRTLRTNLMFSGNPEPLKTLVITSPGSGDGKTTTAINLAAAFAQQGMRVLLIDCDFRRSQLAQVFHVPAYPGLTDVLLGVAGVSQAIYATGAANLSVLPAGAPRPNPTELLGSRAMRTLVDQLGKRYDMVVIDTPPVLAAADAAILATRADGVLLVLRAGETDRSAAQYALRQLASVRARVVGAVLNDPDARVSGYGDYYADAYASTPVVAGMYATQTGVGATDSESVYATSSERGSARDAATGSPADRA